MLEHRIFAFRQFDAAARYNRIAPVEIGGQLSDDHAFRGMAIVTPDDRIGPRQHFGPTDRADDHIIRAKVQQVRRILGVAEILEHDDGVNAARGTHRADIVARIVAFTDQNRIGLMARLQQWAKARREKLGGDELKLDTCAAQLCRKAGASFFPLFENIHAHVCVP